MPIYTKTGDTGETALFGGKRLPKYDPQVEAYGAVDEASCFIGLALSSIGDSSTCELLTSIQYQLYTVMAYLANAPIKENELEEAIPRFEAEIDHLEKSLPKLNRFILPQGSEATVRLHVARAMVRSAERRTVAFLSTKKEQSTLDLLVVQYLNRLSDLLFMLARKYSEEEKRT